MSAPGCQVRRFGSPPSAGTTYTSTFPPYCALNAISLPSGENFGFSVVPRKLVMRRALPPLLSTTQTLFAYANAIWVLLTVGVRSMRVCADSVDAATLAAARRTGSRVRDIGVPRLGRGCAT